ncbi:hypothetical protein CBL_03528 [Carabus blaptoides fortunei]
MSCYNTRQQRGLNAVQMYVPLASRHAVSGSSNLLCGPRLLRRGIWVVVADVDHLSCRPVESGQIAKPPSRMTPPLPANDSYRPHYWLLPRAHRRIRNKYL